MTGEAIVAVWAAFPDATFELVRVREIAPGQVAHEWLVRAQHRAAHGRLARHGAHRHLPGNDVIAVEGGKIRSVEVSYDRQAADAQLENGRRKNRRVLLVSEVSLAKRRVR